MQGHCQSASPLAPEKPGCIVCPMDNTLEVVFQVCCSINS